MHEEIKKIIAEYEKQVGFPLDVGHLRYTGKSKTFLTWTITGEEPALSANDEDLCSICSLDLDLFSDGNYLDIKREIKRVMKENGWVWVEDSEEMYEEDTGLYHQTCSFEKERIL